METYWTSLLTTLAVSAFLVMFGSILDCLNFRYGELMAKFGLYCLFAHIPVALVLFIFWIWS